jgi:ion channel
MGTAQNEPADQMREARLFRRLRHSFRSTDSYGLVLLLIVATYILAASVQQRWGASLLVLAQIGTVWLALHTSRARPGLRLAVNVLFVLAAAGALGVLFVDRVDLLPELFVAGSLLYFVAPISIVRHIGFRAVVDEETMLGALAAYLLIGMAFGFAYRAVGGIQAGPFFGAQGDGTVSQDLFFSFVTLTTTGYGNLVPVANPGQSMAVLEALLGQLFLVTAVAKIVTVWRPRGWRDASADPPASG